MFSKRAKIQNVTALFCLKCLELGLIDGKTFSNPSLFFKMKYFGGVSSCTVLKTSRITNYIYTPGKFMSWYLNVQTSFQ